MLILIQFVMVKQILLIIGFLYSIQVLSQTGIGITTPDPSAKLHVSATDKGFLPPRIALTAINSATPITSPANGLMVFNTATAGVNPYQVVPGYYYWDGTGQQWVSLSTTVGNVQNQAIFRSTSSTTGTSVVTSWNSRFNNIANGDLTFSSNTTFALSNGIYKIQWGLPHQSTQTYNMMQLQENISGSWGAWLNDANFANVANGGNTDWGGTSFMTDVIDCSSSTRTLRFTNPDGRALLTGASFIITKLNPAITTSTTADNFGNHTATKNLLLNGNYLSNDGGNEGIRVDNSGNVGIGTNTPTEKLEVSGNVKATNFIGTASSATLYLLEANSNANYTLPGPWINDLCRYNNVNNTINVPSSWFNTSTYRFTPQKAGYWEIIANYDVYRNAESYLFIQKNGSTVAQLGAFNLISAMVNKIVYLNGSTDYITVLNQGGAAYARSQNASISWFQARWVGE